MSHACAVPDCPRQAKDGQLMCWPHWRRVPRSLNRAIFATVNGDRAAYRQNVDEAVRIVQAKEATDEAAS